MPKAAQIRVEYIYDPESRNWCFRAPNLGIIGGAETRDEAEIAVIEAIRFTLEGDDEAPTPDSEIGYIQVALGGVA